MHQSNYQKRIELLELALKKQVEAHYATWMAARAEVEGAATSHRLFHKEPEVIEARNILGKLYPEPE